MSGDRLFGETVELTAEQRDKLVKPVPLESRVAEIEMRLDDVGILFLNDWCKMVEHDFAKLVERVKDLENIIKDGEVFDPYDNRIGSLENIMKRDGGMMDHMARRLSAIERKVF